MPCLLREFPRYECQNLVRYLCVISQFRRRSECANVFTTDKAIKLMVGAYVGVPASIICVLHRLYMTISSPTSIPDKVRIQETTQRSPFSHSPFQRLYQLLCKLALMLGMPALIIVVRESPSRFPHFLELIQPRSPPRYHCPRFVLAIPRLA